MESLFKPTTSCLSADQIDRYLAQEMSREEVREVENHLIDCPFCSDAVEGFQYLKDAGIQTQAKDIFVESTPEPQLPSVSSPRIVRLLSFRNMAATLLLLIVSVVALQLFWAQQAGLHQQYYTSIANIEYASTRSNEANMNDRGEWYEQGMNLYDLEQYKQSIAPLEKQVAQDPEDGESRFFLAMALMETEQFARANTHLEVVRINEPVYYAPATFNLALTKLKLGQIDMSKQLLEELASTGSTNPNIYEQKAKALLQEDLTAY